MPSPSKRYKIICRRTYLQCNLFQLGLTTTTKCAIDCMSALTLCTLDMQDVMYKLLPEVLLKLSKISTTLHMAIPMLEFLSSNIFFRLRWNEFIYIIWFSSSTHSTSQGVCIFCVRPILVCVCDCFAIHKSIQIQPLCGVTCASRDCRLVFQEPNAIQEQTCWLHHQGLKV